MPRLTLKPVAAEMVEKMECLWKPAQSGKTKEIQDIIRGEEGLRTQLNIIICSKNRLLASQTAKRMENARDDMDDRSVDTDDMDADDEVAGGVYCWMSGAKKTNINAAELAIKVFRGEVSMIVCCSHKVRFQYLHDMLGILEDIGYRKPVNVWLDEADAYVNLWADEFDFSKRRSVHKVIPVSATFDNVLKRFGKIKVMALPVTHLVCYRGLWNCEFAEEEYLASPVDYLGAMLDRYPGLASKGMRLFTPGAMKMSSHDDIAKELLKRNFAVLILNGKSKEFRLPDGSVHPIKLSVDGDELAYVLSEKYVELGLARFPFAVTGHMCLNRGITFQSPGFLFDGGIVPNIDDGATAYQCVARMLGNVGEFPESKAPLVVMSAEMKVATMRQERIAVNLPKLVHEKKWTWVGKEEYERAVHDTDAEYAAAKAAAKDKFDDADFEHEWSDLFYSLEEAKANGWGDTGRILGKDERGFYKNRYNRKSGIPMSVADYEIVYNGKKTMLAKFNGDDTNWTKVNMVFYEDVTDSSTARFVFKRVRRVDPGAVGPAAAGGLPA